MVLRPLQKLDGNSNAPCVHYSILKEKSEWLERLFEEEKVFRVTPNFNVDKAPSLDGYYLAFFQSCWSVIKANIMEIFQNFMPTVNFKKSLNATFICLIPKKRDIVEVKDFRPISLIGGVYKIIAKVLANTTVL